MISVIYILILVAFFLWMRRSTKKAQEKEKAMHDSVRPGMYVMLKDGLYGTVVDVDKDMAVINFSIEGRDEGCLCVEKANISSITEADTGQAPAAGEAAGAPAGIIGERAMLAVAGREEDEEENGTDSDMTGKSPEQEDKESSSAIEAAESAGTKEEYLPEAAGDVDEAEGTGGDNASA